MEIQIRSQIMRRLKIKMHLFDENIESFIDNVLTYPLSLASDAELFSKLSSEYLVRI